MSFYEDILFDVFKNKPDVCISENTDEYIEHLMKRFTFKGDFIDWNDVDEKISLHINSNNEHLLKSSIVANIKHILLEKINKEEKIIYFNDNCFEQSLIFDNYIALEKYIFNLTDNFVQRGYYINLDADWCLLLRDTTIINFGFSSKKVNSDC